MSTAIFTDLNEASHALSRPPRCQCLVMFRWRGWAWLGARRCEWSPEQRAQSLQLHPPAQIGALLSGAGCGGGWLSWLELLELVTGSEPARRSQRVTPSPYWQSLSSISLLPAATGNDQQPARVCAGSCTFVCVIVSKHVCFL